MAGYRCLSGLLRRLAMTACLDSYGRLLLFIWIASQARNDGMPGFVWQVITVFLDCFVPRNDGMPGFVWQVIAVYLDCFAGSQ